MATTKAWIWRLVLTAFFGIVVIVFEFGGLSPAEKGFWKDDPDLSYPIRDQKVPTLLLLFLSIIVPMLVILISEVYIIKSGSTTPASSGASSGIERVIELLLVTIICWGFTLTLTNMIKLTVGAHRPFFLAVCKPDYDTYYQGLGYTGANDTSILVKDNFIPDSSVCTGDATEVNEARRSFPSGHASLMVGSQMWVAAYLYYVYLAGNSNVPAERSYFIIAVQMGLLCLGLWAGYSRISDLVHFYVDVIFGSVLGALCTIFFAYVYLRPLSAEASGESGDKEMGRLDPVSNLTPENP